MTPTPSEREAVVGPLRPLAAIGVPIFFARPAMKNGERDWDGGTGKKVGKPLGYWLPKVWEQTKPGQFKPDDWDGESAICVLGGFGLDIVDEDPRNGSEATLQLLDGQDPICYAEVLSASGGLHRYIASLGLVKHKLTGIDLLGKSQFAFAPGTLRRSKNPDDNKEIRGYEWIITPDAEELATLDSDTSGTFYRDYFAEHGRGTEPPAPDPVAGEPRATPRPKYKSFDKPTRAYHDRYVKGTIVASEIARMECMTAAAVQDFGSNRTTYYGEPWHATLLDIANNLAKTARSRWHKALTTAEAKTVFLDHAPTDQEWHRADNEGLWNDAVNYADREDRVRDVPPPRLGSDLGHFPGDTPKGDTPDTGGAGPSAEEAFPELAAAKADLHGDVYDKFKTDFIREQATKYRSDQEFLRLGLRFKDSNLCLSGILAYPEPDWLIENMLPRDSLVLGYGDSGLGKTSYFVTVGLCIASGTKFTGLPVKQGKAIYIAAEGPALIPMLVRAWRAANPDAVLAEDSFTLHTIPLNLDSASAVADAKAAITEGQYGVVFIDTLIANAGEKDESSPGHMSALMAEGKDLVSGVPGASLVFVHHTGYDKSHPRGATSIYAAADAVIRLSGERGAGRPVRVELEKNRYGRTGDIGNVVLVAEHGSVVVKAKGDLPTLTEELKGRNKSWALLYETYRDGVTSQAKLVQALCPPKGEGPEGEHVSRATANRHISELRDIDQVLTYVGAPKLKQYIIQSPATTPVVAETIEGVGNV